MAATFIAALVAGRLPARADSVTGYSLFAGHSIVATGGITSPGGAIGSNGDLFLSGTNVQSVRAGGSLFDDFGGVDTTGDVTVNGYALMTFFGNVGGNLNAGHDANLTANVAGDIRSGGSVTTSGATTGSISARGAITNTGTVGGGVHPFAAVTPPSYSSATLPSAHTFTSGGPSFMLNTFATQTLLPSSYGDLVMIGSNTVNLSSGNYYFADIRMLGSFVTFNFDTTKGPINIYVSGPVFFQDADMKLNGVSFGSIAPSDASQVYWETHDNFHAEFSNLLGTIYAPFGDIQSVKLSQSKGELIAGIDLITDGGTYTAGAASQSLLVPEPAAMTLIIAATASAAIPALLRRRRARGRVRRCVS